MKLPPSLELWQDKVADRTAGQVDTDVLLFERLGLEFKKLEIETMKCAACQSQMVKKKGEIDLRIGGVLYLARNVPFEECQCCGEKILSPEVSQDLFTKIKKGMVVKETMQIPVLDGRQG